MTFNGKLLIAATGVHGPFDQKDRETGVVTKVTYPWATIVDLVSGDVFEKVTLSRDMAQVNGTPAEGQGDVELYKNNDGELKLRLLRFEGVHAG
jgi:hypothetical protein